VVQRRATERLQSQAAAHISGAIAVLRAAFPDRPWLDVRSKADLPLGEGLQPADVPPGTLHVSVHNGRGIDELCAQISLLVAQVDRLVDAPVREDGFVSPGDR